MFRIGDKVEFPVTQSTMTNNVLSSVAKAVIRYAKSLNQDYLFVRDITVHNGIYNFKLTASVEGWAYATIFHMCDLVPYGHSGLMFAPAVVGTSRVKCHCGKTHQLMTNNGTSSTIYTTINDSAGWHIRLNNSFVKKPRGQQWYVYYVAYCPECWRIEKLRRESAEVVLPLIPPEEPPDSPVPATQPESSRPSISRPFSIWIHHKGGIRT